MSTEDKEFESFMLRVDKIGEIIHGLCSEDKNVSEGAKKEADLFLEGRKLGNLEESSCPVKHNRTVINQAAFNSDPESSVSKEMFMSMMSKDAEERARSKRERESKAKKFVSEAKKFIKSNDYESALHRYNKAIAENVNWPRLYAERANIHLNLKLFKRTMEDCDKAAKLNEDLFMLKGDSATAEDKNETESLNAEIRRIKKEAVNQSQAY